MPLENKLTIVIPTYNRHSYVLRAIRYWDNLGVKTIVMDGSKDAIIPSELKTFKNCNYHHLPIAFLDRLKIAKELIETPYVSLIPDDEFFIGSTIIKCIEAIEEKDIESCGGQCLKFAKGKNDLTYSLVYKKLRNYNFLEDNAIDRMKKHMLDYTPSTLYSIMKKEAWCKCMDLMTKRIVDVYALLEIQFEMAATFHGKSMVLPDVLWMRSDENKPVRNEPGLFKDKVFSKWWPDPSKHDEHQIVIQDMLENFTSSKYTDDRVRKGVEESFNNIVSFQNKFEGGLSHKLALRFPLSMGKYNQVRKFLLPKTKTYSLNEIMKFDDGKTLIIPKKEIEALHKTVLNFHFQKQQR